MAPYMTANGQGHSDRSFQDAGEVSAPNEAISLDEVARFLRHYARTIIACIALASCVASYVVFTSRNLYTAVAEVLIDPRISQIQREQVGDVIVPIDTAQMESQLALLRSEGLARSVIEQLDLLNDPEFQPRGPSLLARIVGFFGIGSRPPASLGDKLRTATSALRAELDVARVGVSYAISISFRSSDAQKAAKVANAFASIYVQDQIHVRSKAAQAGSLWLEEKMNVLRVKMNAAARSVQEFKARHDYRLKPPQEPVAAGEGAVAQRAALMRRDEAPVTLDELDATSQTYRKLYETHLTAYSSLLLRESYPVSDARVISTAVAPIVASHPRSLLILLFGLLVGSLLGLGGALVQSAMTGGRQGATVPRHGAASAGPEA